MPPYNYGTANPDIAAVEKAIDVRELAGKAGFALVVNQAEDGLELAVPEGGGGVTPEQLAAEAAARAAADLLRLKPMGAYSGVTAYAVNDQVEYGAPVVSYRCIAASTGNLPTNATYWVAMGSAGGGASGFTWSTGLSAGFSSTTLTDQVEMLYWVNNVESIITLVDTGDFGTISIGDLGAATLSFDNLKQIRIFDSTNAFSVGEFGDSAATTIAFPVLEVFAFSGYINFNSPNLANLSFNPAIKRFGGFTDITQNRVRLNASASALTEASVDGILALFVGLDGTGGTTLCEAGSIDLSGGTSAPPSVAGAADAVTLSARGITVTTN